MYCSIRNPRLFTGGSANGREPLDLGRTTSAVFSGTSAAVQIAAQTLLWEDLASSPTSSEGRNPLLGLQVADFGSQLLPSLVLGTMDAFEPFLHFDQPISPVALLLAGMIVALAVVILRSWDHAVGTSPNRDDLETRKGLPLIGNLAEIGRHRDSLIERELLSGERGRIETDVARRAVWVYMRREQVDKKKHLTLTAPFRRIIECNRPEVSFIRRPWAGLGLLSSVVVADLAMLPSPLCISHSTWNTYRRRILTIMSR